MKKIKYKFRLFCLMMAQLLVGFVIKSRKKETCVDGKELYFDPIWYCEHAYHKLFDGFLDLKSYYFNQN